MESARYKRDVDATPLSFLQRLVLAFKSLFTVLFDPGFAVRVAALFELTQSRPDAEPQAPPASASPSDGERRSEPAGPSLVRAAAEPRVLSAEPSTGFGPGQQGALALLRVLQREGRLLDFLEQDVTPFSDAEVGAVARVVHEGCGRALHQQLKLQPISSTPEGDVLTLAEEAELKSGKWKLTGNVGKPPYRGTLRHKGWLASELHLPMLVGREDPRVLCPAELELG